MTPQFVLDPDCRTYLQRPACPRCGDTLMAAAASELIARGHIRNSWSCDSCGHDFVTAVRLSRAVMPTADLD